MVKKPTVYDQRKYRVKNVEDAKQISTNYLKDIDLNQAIEFGLPEVDDRYHLWRVPLKGKGNNKIGEIVIDAYTSLIQEPKTTQKEILEARLLGRTNGKTKKTKKSWCA